MEAQQPDDKRNRQLEAKAILIKAAIRQKMNEVKMNQQQIEQEKPLIKINELNNNQKANSL